MSGYFARVAARLLNVGPTLRPAANPYLIALRDDGPATEIAEHDAPIGGRAASAAEAAPAMPAILAPAIATNVAPRYQQAAHDVAPSKDFGFENERAIDGDLLAEEARPGPPSRSEHEEAVPHAAVRERQTREELVPLAIRQPRFFPLEPARRLSSAGIGERFETPRQAEPPAVHVHIGRIDVRAVEAPAPPKPPPNRTAPRAPSLEEHLRARERNAG